MKPKNRDGGEANWEIERHALLDSTQTTLENLADRERVHRRVVVADRQTGGRGRRGHLWCSPEGGLWCSLALELAGNADPFHGLLLALSAVEAVENLLDQSGIDNNAGQLGLEWPNDIVAGNAKWGGLIATVRNHEAGALYIFGLGLNLQVSAADLSGVDSPVTSIEAEFGISPSPSQALSRILCRFDQRLADDRRDGRAASLEQVIVRLGTIDRAIYWQEADGVRSHGRAVGLESDGALRVELEDGDVRVLRSADVHHLRENP